MAQRKRKEAAYNIIGCPAATKKQAKAWLQRVRRDNLPKPNSSYVCCVHFTPDCYETDYKASFGIKCLKRLKPGSIPSVFQFPTAKPDAPPQRQLPLKRKLMEEKIMKREVRTIIHVACNLF